MMDEFNKCCRLCLHQADESISVFENCKNILIELSTCLSIEITSDDILPKIICNNCADLLHNYYNFYMNAKYCEETLLAYLNMKNDTLDNNFVTENSNNQIVSEEVIQTDGINSPCESEFFAEFLDSSNNSFDVDLLTNDSNTLTTLDHIGMENQTSTDVANKLLNSGVKVTKITNFKKDNNCNSTDDSYEIHMEIDVLDSDLHIVNELLSKKKLTTPSSPLKDTEVNHVENYSCMSCKSIFNHFDLLAEHMGGCEALKRTCVECRTVFETKSQMMKHRSIHNVLLTFNCHQCTKQFLDQDRLDRHMESSHGDFSSDTNSIFRCRECGDLFAARDALYQHAKCHVKISNKLNSDKFICEDCGNIYTNKPSLQNHKRQHHGITDTVPVMFRCKACTAVFRDKRRLYSHVQRTHLPHSTPHLCDTCGKSFNSYNALARHVLIHVGKQFQCDICTRQYINGSLLEKHLLTHKADTKVCEVCGIIFANEVLLNIHHEKHNKK